MSGSSFWLTGAAAHGGKKSFASSPLSSPTVPTSQRRAPKSYPFTLCVVAAVLAAAGPSVAQPARTACSVGDIRIKSFKARFVNECSGSPCPVMRGVGVLINSCRESVGVELKMTGLDGAGAPLETRDLWPASVSNIPPGEYEFSLDHWLRYDKTMKSFTLRPVNVYRWR